MRTVLEPAELPVLADVDAAIIGGSFAGISCALELAKAGRSVMVVEPRTYLGREWSSTLRYGVGIPFAQTEEWPSLMCWVTDQSREGTSAGKKVSIHPDRFKRCLEDLLLEKDIGLLYASLPVSVETESGVLRGLTIANKSGRQFIRCRHAVDATETALLAKLCGSPADKYAPGETALYFRTLEFTDTAETTAGPIPVPAGLGLVDHAVTLRRGCRGTGHVYADFALELPSGNDPASDRARELQARYAGMKLAVHLIREVPAFRKAVLAGASHELLGPFPHHGFAAADQAPRPGSRPHHAGIPGVHALFLEVYREGNTRLFQPLDACKVGEGLAADILARDESAAAVDAAPAEVFHPEFSDIKLVVPSLYSDRDGTGSAFSCSAMEVPVFKKVDVLVAGGGSSGGSATIASAEEGRSTLLLDLNPGPGGTGTYGGVDSYWFGRKAGYANRIHDAVMDVQRDLNYKGHKWNIEAKTYALLREADRRGADWLFNSIVFGAAVQANRVCGAVAATRWGPFAILAETVIDATGDGDIAAYAGASFVYGSEKDHTVMWYSLAQFQEPAKIKNNFTGMVDISDVADYTRAILAGRRRGVPDLHDHGIYVATRESRHVRGDAAMTLADQLLQRKWPDVVNIHFSNHDVKGVSGADWVNVGLIPPNLEIEIPYGVLLPQGLEGILVAGKAVSATHDALPAIRMQADLENLGAIAALAASQAVSDGVRPRNIDIRRLQERLEKEGLLPEGTSTRELTPFRYGDEELQALVGNIETEALFEYSNMRMNETYRSPIPFVEIASAGPRIVPFLEKALAEAEGIRKVRIAQALAMHGSKAGAPVLVAEIMKDLGGDALPVRTADIMYVQLPPDHGAMPDAAYLLYSLAQTRDERSIPVWERVAALMESVGEEDFKDSLKGVYYFVDAVCQGAERLGSRGAVPALEAMHGNPRLNGLSSPHGFQPDYFLERRAMLELAIGRALARCGSPSGYEILIRYVTDARSLLSKQAQLELGRLTGQAFGRDADKWSDWTKTHQPYEKTQPQTLRLDMVADSGSMLRKVVSP